jgi:16S rRNA (uracil1498-N3)-methyltransferase
LEYLSNIELYICSNYSEDNSISEISGEEYHHLIKVMRHKVGDKIFATNGLGKIFECIINDVGKVNTKIKILKTLSFNNVLDNFTFCIPNLKNAERLKYAIEKSVELGVTDFIIFNSDRTIGKSINLNRLNKIALAAMKQSLHSYFPEIKLAISVSDLLVPDNQIILFDQSSELIFGQHDFDNNIHYRFVFGPEGSLSDSEIKTLNPEFIYNLDKYRLRSETAVVKCASILSSMIKNG